MSKRTTAKAQREAEEKAALRQRLEDLALGANGGYDIEDPESGIGIYGQMGADAFSRFLCAVERAFELGRNASDSAETWEKKTALHCSRLERFESIESAVNWLYSIGVRA